MSDAPTPAAPIPGQYHRHVRGFETIVEFCARIANDGPERFEFCNICGCVPDTIIGQTPDPATGSQVGR